MVKKADSVLLQPSCVSRAAKLRVPKKYGPTVRYKDFRMMPLPVAFDRAGYANGCLKNRASAEKLCILLSVVCCQVHKASDSSVFVDLEHFGI